MLSQEQLKTMSVDQLVGVLLIEIPFHNMVQWIELVRSVKEAVPEKLAIALGIISMDKREEFAVWALNTSCINRHFIRRARFEGNRRVRELAGRLLEEERYPEFWV